MASNQEYGLRFSERNWSCARNSITRPKLQPVTLRRARASNGARCELNRGKRAPVASDPPGANVVAHLHNGAVPVGEHDIDRKPHEEGVDGAARGEYQTRAIEATAPQEAPAAGSGGERGLQTSRQNRTRRCVLEHPLATWLPHERRKKHRGSNLNGIGA